MSNQEHGETFRYSYRAGDQEEIRRIREKYVPKEEDKLERLRRLDAGVTQKGTVTALILGVLGCLILGTGMSMIMVWGGELFLPGVIVGVVGLAAVMAAFPVYGHVVKKERERLAPEILRLTDELIDKQK